MSLTANFDYCVELGLGPIKAIFHLALKNEALFPHIGRQRLRPREPGKVREAGLDASQLLGDERRIGHAGRCRAVL